MPTYDYVCTACDHAFELFQQMSAEVETICPKCGKTSLKRLIGTGAAVLFKGSGFYETDYRTRSYKSGAEADKKAGDSSTSSGDSTSPSGESTSKSDGGQSSEGPKKTDSGSSSQSGGES